ncbi:hypothetical protein BDW59DRAFT_151706 [Aspergillus cavernicola]|uniref:Ubiquitin-like domain-containing protein n=1 Tax=Aspergillus cavernicola TaxID=176166 RepID=A0ABR4HU17_9EURO
MGCCFSLSRDVPYTQATTGEHHQHQDPQTASPPPHPSSSPSPSHPRHLHLHRSRPPNSHQPSSSQHHHPVPVPLPEHINAPIRPHTWHSKRRRWTRPLLDQERTEFFETRVTGRPEVWAALSTALILMRTGDLGTAQSIIDAAGVTVPTGDLCQGCYDEQGVLYRLPRCIVSDPENIVLESSKRDDEQDEGTDEDDVDVDEGFEMEDRKFALDEASGDELIAGEDEDVERERRRDEKGKASERDIIRVKARLSDRDGQDLVVAIKKTQNVGFLARKVQQDVGIPRTQRVRIAYLGKILKEHTPLVDQGWKPGHVVNALVVSRHPSS